MLGNGLDVGIHFQEHVEMLSNMIEGSIELGPRPDDLAKVMAEFALASPGTCALRSLRRVAAESAADDFDMLSSATRVAFGFRTLFNLPETIALLRGNSEETYWRLVLNYGLSGNLQSILDEQVHMLLESLGLKYNTDMKQKADEISSALADSLSIRTGQLTIDELIPYGQKIQIHSYKTRCRFALKFGELQDDRDSTLARADTVRNAFNSPFRPFILTSTSVGQEGLDFHPWCHAVLHWNLPSTPVDLEQREGRVHRYKGHAIRKNIAKKFGLSTLTDWSRKGDPWDYMFNKAVETRKPGDSDIIPYWIFEIENGAKIERRVPLLPFSREVQQLKRLKEYLALYRLVFGQPRQEDLLVHLSRRIPFEDAEHFSSKYQISLMPPCV
jgi:hypothetical protein